MKKARTYVAIMLEAFLQLPDHYVIIVNEKDITHADVPTILQFKYSNSNDKIDMFWQIEEQLRYMNKCKIQIYKKYNQLMTLVVYSEMW